MGLMDAFTVLAVLGSFIFLIWARIYQKNPEIINKMKEFFSSKPKIPENLSSDEWRQRYEEKRGLI